MKEKTVPNDAKLIIKSCASEMLKPLLTHWLNEPYAIFFGKMQCNDQLNRIY